MTIVGISSYFHDSAVSLIRDGQIVFAAQEERFTRVKHDPRFPSMALARCFRECGISDWSQVDKVVFFEKPYLKFERILETVIAVAPLGFRQACKSLVVWITEKLFMKKALMAELEAVLPGFPIHKLAFSNHHLSHAASAFYPCPFHEATVVTMDGVGEWTTTSVYHGINHTLNKVAEIQFPHSLGLLYSAITYFCGFKVNSGEYKVMGLAPYGKPRFANLMRQELIFLHDDGSFALNMSFFSYCTSLEMTGRRLEKLFGVDRRLPESSLTATYIDIAASLQMVIEEAIRRLVLRAVAETGSRNVCLAGGVALNCVANGKLLHEEPIEQLWIQPAAGDAGGSLGAALAWYYQENSESIERICSEDVSEDQMQGCYLGPQYSNAEIEKALMDARLKFERIDYDDRLFDRVAAGLETGRTVGWMQGRMEFGPRALGNRSILGHPGFPNMQRDLNLKIKYRESFRPFAPAILEEKLSQWFDLEAKSSPYMLLVGLVKSFRLNADNEEQLPIMEKLQATESKIPAVTHVDGSARIQTINRKTNPSFYNLTKAFEKRTGLPLLINTSFNVRSEPIVESPQDAIRCFLGTDLDLLVIGNYIVDKSEQEIDVIDDASTRVYFDEYELD